MSLGERIRALPGHEGMGAREVARQLDATPAAVQEACWAEGIKIWGLPDLSDRLEGIVSHGQTSMFEAMRRTKLSAAAIRGTCERNGWPVPG